MLGSHDGQGRGPPAEGGRLYDGRQGGPAGLFQLARPREVQLRLLAALMGVGVGGTVYLTAYTNFRDSTTLVAQFGPVCGLSNGTAGYWGKGCTTQGQGRMEVTHL